VGYKQQHTSAAVAADIQANTGRAPAAAAAAAAESIAFTPVT
jgi:hypothetical protein